MLNIVLLFFCVSALVSAHNKCTCVIEDIPVCVDVAVAVNPTDPVAGFNETGVATRRVKDCYSIHSVLCQPDLNKYPGLVQLLLHGQTYNHQYWTMPSIPFSNYSYVQYACSQGLTSFAYDSLGAGLSTRPQNASDVQVPVGANIALQLGQYLRLKKGFAKVVAVGHSLGSVLLNFVAIASGSGTPFNGIALTSYLHKAITISPTALPITPARDVDPLRWGNLDPGYIATPAGFRNVFYSPDTSTYSPSVLAFDELTKDAGSEYPTLQGAAGNFTADGYQGPVLHFVGSMDRIYCGNFSCDGAQAPSAAFEKTFWPDSRNVSVKVSHGSGHDMDLDFFANGVYKTLFEFVTGVI